MIDFTLQNESNNSSIRVDLLNWEFIPILKSLDDLIAPPKKGVYIHNLYLENAGWDNEKTCLCEPLPLQLVTKLPIIHFIPVEGKMRLKDLYQSPVYYCPQRNETRDRKFFEIALNLKCGSQKPEHWIKRATAVLLNLE
uniref:Dynein heavy chain 2, axonemal n=1 Tax=Sipha flava TaxID=143950 RepID=A0A2S2QW58_9HEMI